LIARAEVTSPPALRARATAHWPTGAPRRLARERISVATRMRFTSCRRKVS
jgi:hypothetical protein